MRLLNKHTFVPVLLCVRQVVFAVLEPLVILSVSCYHITQLLVSTYQRQQKIFLDNFNWTLSLKGVINFKQSCKSKLFMILTQLRGADGHFLVGSLDLLHNPCHS